MSDSKSSGGTNFFGLLTIAFVVLKLCKIIDWSWWWVLAPTWIVFLLALFCYTIVAIIKELSKKD